MYRYSKINILKLLKYSFNRKTPPIKYYTSVVKETSNKSRSRKYDATPFQWSL